VSNHPLKIKHNNFKLVKQEVQERAITLSNHGKQLDIGIPDPKLNFAQRAKRSIVGTKNIQKIDSYWDSMLTIAAIMLSLFYVGFMTFFVFEYYNVISDTFPLFYSQATKSWQMYDKESIPLFIIVVGGILGIIIKLNHITYSFDKRLSNMINISLIIMNLLGVVAFTEIFSLLLIY